MVVAANVQGLQGILTNCIPDETSADPRISTDQRGIEEMYFNLQMPNEQQPPQGKLRCGT